MTQRLRLEIPVILPEVADAADACVGRLVAELEGRAGVERVHVDVPAAGEAGPPLLCIHYDPGRISLSRIREFAESAGVGITRRIGHLLWRVEGRLYPRRARIIAAMLRKLPGVFEAGVNASGVIAVEYDRQLLSEQQIRATLAGHGLGERAKETAGGKGGHDHAHAHSHGGGTPGLLLALLCGALLMVGFLLDRLWPDAPAGVVTAFYIAAYAAGGYHSIGDAVESLRLGRFEIDTLMLVAAAGAAALGAWAEGALLLFLFSLGHALEHYAMERARREIESLSALAPETAMVRRGTALVTVAVAELAVGDRVVVRPGERVAADGFVLSGHGSIDQAPVTGESIPADKVPVADAEAARARPEAVAAESRVFAGSVNGGGSLDIEVTAAAAESTLARMVRMVREAETRRSPTQRLTDRFERVFVPLVLALALVLMFAFLLLDEPFSASFYRSMTVLVAASPCALAISTPSAVLAGVARAAKGGVLVKGGAPLELLGALSAIAFDKTGTLTTGKPSIRGLLPAPGVAKEELLAVAVAVQKLSDHPLARAIVRDAAPLLGEAAIPEATGLVSRTGFGVSAEVDGEAVWIGKAALFGTDGVPPLSDAARRAVQQLRERGETLIVVRRGSRELGVIGLVDPPRPEAKATIGRLRALGIRRLAMLSGDHQRAADGVAREVGLDEAFGDLLPEHKVETILRLRLEGEVAMVGDGVNDAPAMANASVGIAMGAAGSAVALETADVALMADDLARLPFAVGLSRQTRRVIRQNLLISLGMVAVLIPATILGLRIGPAVAFHEGSTLLVVLNALRLLRFRAPA